MATAAAGGTRFGFTKIIVADMDRAIAFYEAVLGMKVLDRYDLPNILEVGLVLPGHEDGHMLVLYYHKKERALEIGNAWGPIGFFAADVDAVYARALAAGGAPYQEPYEFQLGMRIAFFLDPDGHQVEVISM